MELNFLGIGDIHGKQNLMYDAALEWQDRNKVPLDAILQVGDFETIRNEADFEQYYAPKKYHRISDFSEYYSGLRAAPILTVLIAGNHEAWGHLKDYQSGGFIAPNMYYLGRSGVIDVKGARVAGISGIYSQRRYKKEVEGSPSDAWKHYRQSDVERIWNEKADILLLHDWVFPLPAEPSGDEVKHDPKLRSPTYNLVEKLSPKYVLMGHIHKSHLDEQVGKTRFIGLSEFTRDLKPTSMRHIRLRVKG